MLSARGVSFDYGLGTGYETPALAGIELDIAPGSVLLVSGETGSGKTTLLRLLAGLIEPTVGTVALDGTVPEPAAVEKERRIGLLFQRAEAQLFAESVLADVAFGPRNLGASQVEAAEAARAALGVVGLDPESFSERSPFTLSGGEARRVALAGVLAMEPRYLLLDEPTAGLDAVGRDAVRRAVADASASSGVVVVTHDTSDMLDLADAVVVLSGGRQVFSGDVQRYMEVVASGTQALPVPEVLAIQLAARDAGLALQSLHSSPVDAAREIARACQA